MRNNPQPLDTLKDIKHMMERSSRFISLSGLSGVAAGCCALVGAWLAYDVINRNPYSFTTGRDGYSSEPNLDSSGNNVISLSEFMGSKLFLISIFTFVAAFVLAFMFTYIRSRKNNIPIWGHTAKRLMLNVSLPMLVGGIYLWKMIQAGIFGLIAPGCLIFYGLALVNASKYTLKEVRYLGIGQVLLGVINLWYIGYGIYFWAVGFGILHIIYGTVMWWRYEKA
jgi:hypothetical protein